MKGLAGRILQVVSPTTLVLALLVFLLPFLTVSCDTPGGYGQMRRGGTTEYSGLDLALGSSPSIDRDHLRRPEKRDDDNLGAQPIALVALGGVIAALFVTFRRRDRRVLRLGVVGCAAGALIIGVAVARDSLIDKVDAQADRAFTASRYVKAGLGFWAALFFIALAAIATALEHWLTRRARAPG